MALSQARQLAVQLFQNAFYPNGLSAASSWLGIYQVLLWYEPVVFENLTALPHIIDADKLRPPAYKIKKSLTSAWQQRAKAAGEYLAAQLNFSPNQTQNHVDLLMRHNAYKGVQRQNPLGIAFPSLICHILGKFGNSSVNYDMEIPAQTVFLGIVVPGRSPNPKIDIVIRNHQGHLRAVISCKWSLRHDRLNDISNECPTYKQAASWTRTKIDYIVVTNEFDPARLNRIIDDSCVDALVHVHKPLPTSVCGLNSRLNNMLDLTDLLSRSNTW